MARHQFWRLTAQASVLAGLSTLMGCSPVFNWRDVRPEQTRLLALFPCKPDPATRVATLAGNQLVVKMLGCDAGEVSFTLAYADLKDAAELNAALLQWRQATLGNVRASAIEEMRYFLNGASESAPVVKVAAQGQHLDGKTMTLQGAWFAHGTQVFQATATANQLNPAASETFLSGIRVQ